MGSGVKGRRTYGCHVDPEGEAVDAAAFEREVVGVHGEGLAGVVSGFVGVFVVHVIGNADFGEDAGVFAHVVQPFFAHCGQLVSEAVPNGCLAEFNGEGWCQITASQDAQHVNVPIAVPMKVTSITR